MTNFHALLTSAADRRGLTLADFPGTERRINGRDNSHLWLTP